MFENAQCQDLELFALHVRVLHGVAHHSNYKNRLIVVLPPQELRRFNVGQSLFKFGIRRLRLPTLSFKLNAPKSTGSTGNALGFGR